MNIMKVKTKVAVPECRSEFRKLKVWVEQTDHALRRMHSDHLFDLGERTHDDLHELRKPRFFDVQVSLCTASLHKIPERKRVRRTGIGSKPVAPVPCSEVASSEQTSRVLSSL
jgi:hypothetical protein